MRYNWQQADWFKFTYSLDEVEEYLYLFTFAIRLGRINGHMSTISEELQL